ncbi:MAG: HNH endonuclease [Bacillota bacterium]
MEKRGRECAYCGKTGVPLEVEHIIPKSRGGTDRITNLALSCEKCNREKGSLTAEEFGHPNIQKQALEPLKDTAAINATRYAVGAILKKYGLPVSFWSGGRTKHNRTKQQYPKSHWIDAACVGESGESVRLDPGIRILKVKAVGHGTRQICGTDKFGFPIRHRSNKTSYFGFQTGDIVRAVVPRGKFAGVHIGRLSVRAKGIFKLNGVGDVSHKYCTVIHRKDGYAYA